jgi:hypothetical protein
MKFGRQKVHTFISGETKMLGAPSDPVGLTSPSYVAQSISPSINSQARSNYPTNATIEATSMLRGSVPYNRQREHVDNYH